MHGSNIRCMQTGFRANALTERTCQAQTQLLLTALQRARAEESLDSDVPGMSKSLSTQPEASLLTSASCSGSVSAA